LYFLRLRSRKARLFCYL
ncbi:hypothetical protein BAE44_0013387, partial [Dichanthelium oligosanthes]